MKCPSESPENGLLLEYCSGRLAPPAAAALDRHLESCPRCARECARQRAVWNALDLWEAEPVTPDFDRRLYRRLEAGRSAAWWRRIVPPSLLRPALPLAAAAALLLAGVWLQRPAGVRTAPPAEPRAQAMELEQVERTLDDLEMLRQFDLMAQKEAEPRRSM